MIICLLLVLIVISITGTHDIITTIVTTIMFIDPIIHMVIHTITIT